MGLFIVLPILGL